VSGPNLTSELASSTLGSEAKHSAKMKKRNNFEIILLSFKLKKAAEIFLQKNEEMGLL
jgi:hypothetical protein